MFKVLRIYIILILSFFAISILNINYVYADNIPNVNLQFIRKCNNTELHINAKNTLGKNIMLKIYSNGNLYDKFDLNKVDAKNKIATYSNLDTNGNIIMYSAVWLYNGVQHVVNASNALPSDCENPDVVSSDSQSKISIPNKHGSDYTLLQFITGFLAIIIVWLIILVLRQIDLFNKSKKYK